MKIKKNDKIKVLAGKDKGKTGKVLQVFPKLGKASVEGVNLLIKHLRPQQKGEKGQRIEFPAPFNLSNMMLLCAKCKKETRVGYKIVESEPSSAKATAGKVKTKKQKFRFCKKCKENI